MCECARERFGRHVGVERKKWVHPLFVRFVFGSPTFLSTISPLCFGTTLSFVSCAVKAAQKWHRIETEVVSKWNRSELEVIPKKIYVNSDWNRNWIQRTPGDQLTKTTHSYMSLVFSKRNLDQGRGISSDGRISCLVLFCFLHKKRCL